MNSNDEWYTPPDIIARARKVLGSIDLDPASSKIAQLTVEAEKYYTKEDNGLLFPWEGKVWCNPPYSAALIKKFTQKFSQEFIDGTMTGGIILTNSGTDTLWNQNLKDGVQVYTKGRISFLQPDGTKKATGSRGQCFTYFGDDWREFEYEFCHDGFCWMPNKTLYF